MLQAGRLRVQELITLMISMAYLILPAALDPGIVQEAGQYCFWRVKRCPRERMTNLPPSVSRLSGQCEIHNISQPYRPPRAVTGIALLFLYVDDVRTSQEAQTPLPDTGIAFLLLYLHTWNSTCITSCKTTYVNHKPSLQRKLHICHSEGCLYFH
jgi:hypothetical protein